MAFIKLSTFQKFFEIEKELSKKELSLKESWDFSRISFALSRNMNISQFDIKADSPDVMMLLHTEMVQASYKLETVELLFGCSNEAIKDLLGKSDTFIVELLTYNGEEHSKKKKEFLDAFDKCGMDKFLESLEKQMKIV